MTLITLIKHPRTLSSRPTPMRSKISKISKISR